MCSGWVVRQLWEVLTEAVDGCVVSKPHLLIKLLRKWLLASQQVGEVFSLHFIKGLDYKISFIIYRLLIKPHENFPQVVSCIPVVGE